MPAALYFQTNCIFMNRVSFFKNKAQDLEKADADEHGEENIVLLVMR